MRYAITLLAAAIIAACSNTAEDLTDVNIVSAARPTAKPAVEVYGELVTAHKLAMFSMTAVADAAQASDECRAKALDVRFAYESRFKVIKMVGVEANAFIGEIDGSKTIVINSDAIGKSHSDKEIDEAGMWTHEWTHFFAGCAGHEHSSHDDHEGSVWEKWNGPAMRQVVKQLHDKEVTYYPHTGWATYSKTIAPAYGN